MEVWRKRIVVSLLGWAIMACFRQSMVTAPMRPACFLCSAWTLQPMIASRSRKDRWIWPLSSMAPTATENTTTEPATNTYLQLYAPTNASSNGTIQTDSVHTLYYETHGNGPLIALFLHGGPGAGCFPNHARFFDPSKYTVVLLDQRGAGRSTPKGCVEDNTLADLVEDCELLRKKLWGKRSWDCVLGGSWGATLGLAYAQSYPQSMRSLVLRGICALRQAEVDWLFSSDGGSAQNPKLAEAWKNFSNAVSVDFPSTGREALHAYYDCLIGAQKYANNSVNEDNAIRLAAARSWMMWEMAATSSAKNQADTNSGKANLVLVSSPDCDGGKWHFENPLGEEILDKSQLDPQQCPEAISHQLRRNIHTKSKDDSACPTIPRPVQIVDGSSPVLSESMGSNNSSSKGFRLPPDYIPAQAMLTCFYSVNDRYVMGDLNLIKNARRHGAPRMKIIGIQGGLDPICPPDTAMELLHAINEEAGGSMELRIPLQSGHSMYDPAIQHELIRATDRLADDFLNSV